MELLRTAIAGTPEKINHSTPSENPKTLNIEDTLEEFPTPIFTQTLSKAKSKMPAITSKTINIVELDNNINKSKSNISKDSILEKTEDFESNSTCSLYESKEFDKGIVEQTKESSKSNRGS